MSFIASHKRKLLSSASRKVLLVGLATARGCGRNARAWGFLLWLRVFLNWLSGEKCLAVQVPILEPAIINRHDRRALGRAKTPVSEIAMLFHLFGRGISRTGFMERMCRLSLHCRVRIYRLRFWGNVLVRRARLVCYDHGWWREPIGDLGRICCGVWRVHLWPEWLHPFVQAQKPVNPQGYGAIAAGKCTTRR